MITQTVDSNEELTKDWNFARLLNQEEHLLYGGPVPFLYRQHYSRLQDFLDNARNKYTNDNYISDGLEDQEVIDRAKEFLEVAKKELVKSSTMQHSISTNLYNLLLIPAFTNKIPRKLSKKSGKI